MRNFTMAKKLQMTLYLLVDSSIMFFARNQMILLISQIIDHDHSNISFYSRFCRTARSGFSLEPSPGTPVEVNLMNMFRWHLTEFELIQTAKWIANETTKNLDDERQIEMLGFGFLLQWRRARENTKPITPNERHLVYLFYFTFGFSWNRDSSQLAIGFVVCYFGFKTNNFRLNQTNTRIYWNWWCLLAGFMNLYWNNKLLSNHNL